MALPCDVADVDKFAFEIAVSMIEGLVRDAERVTGSTEFDEAGWEGVGSVLENLEAELGGKIGE